MDKQEIFEILKSQKKYSSSCVFEEENIFYTINGNRYQIEIWDRYSKLTFYFRYSKYNVREVQIGLVKEKANRKNVLSKFREIINSINKLDFFLKKREEYVNKIQPIILSYIKEQYYLNDIVFDGTNNIFRMNFPKTSILKRRRYRTTSFDTTVEKIDKNFIFEPHVEIKDSGYNINFCFTFKTETNKLTLTSVEENYRNIGKDITKIIRGEKLRKLIFLDEEAN